MTLGIRIAALGLLFGATVPAVYAEESRPISSILSPQASAGGSAELTVEASVEPSPVLGRPVLASQHPGLKPITPADRGEVTPPEKRHRPGELDCSNCHVGKHHGVLQMYLGTGGRGTPMIPSHMFQVRVECVACHIVPKEAEPAAGIVGQTFRPTEQACLNCHGEKYRGMLTRWVETLSKMRDLLAPKLAGARAALVKADPKHPQLARAQQLVDDAEHNLQFVALAKGVHNVFYAADLLKVANGWLDDAVRLLGGAPVTGDDTLVRGGYCGVLCHEQAGVKLPETVSFAKQKVPHGRHVAEFGAVCTNCHSAEVHKAVTATSATCASCHHSPQNERCESCHRAQAAFYRGETKTDLVAVEPNVMAAAVSCTGCHDFTKKHSRKVVGQKCLACHDPGYLAFMDEWTSGLDAAVAEAAKVLQRAEAALGKARGAGAKRPAAEGLVKEARAALDLVKGARGAHNPTAAEALLEVARRKAEEAMAQAAKP